jgi:Ca2+-binding EF-hand superfamily protein
MFYSRNYFHPHWSLLGPYRIKNVICVMEWIPDPAKVRPKLGLASARLSPEQEARLKRSFEYFDVERKGSLALPEIKDLLRSLDVPDAQLDMEAWMQFIDTNQDGRLDFQELRRMMVSGSFTKSEYGRCFVALSLAEAESLRGVVHQTRGRRVVPNSNAEFGLLADGILLDASAGYRAAGAYQATAVQQCFRFLNCETFYKEHELNLCLRAVQDTPCAERWTWFEEINECRRRSKQPVERTPLMRLFTMGDEFHVLESRARLAQIRALIKRKNMMLLDAFRAFDRDRNGVLDCSEIYSALGWLGLSVTPEDVYDLVRTLDQDQNGKINYREYADALRTPGAATDDDWEDGTSEVDMQRVHNAIQHESIPELADMLNPKKKKEKKVQGYDAALGIPLSAKVLSCKKRNVFHFTEVWNSKSTASRDKVSVWSPKAEGYVRTSKVLLDLGHYASSTFSHPGKSACYFSLTDLECNGVLRSEHLEPSVVNQLFPHPVSFQQVWSQKQQGASFYAWRAIAPEGHAALGMVGTTTPEEPALSSMRCIPLRLLKVSRDKPKKIWDDSGTGGRAGSFWQVTSMQLLHVAQGHSPPKGPFYELATTFGSEKVKCSVGVNDKDPPPRGYNMSPGAFSHKES